MHPQRNTDGSAHLIPFPSFPPVMTDNSASSAPGNNKSYGLASSCLNCSNNAFNSSDTHGVSCSRDNVNTSISAMQGSASVVHMPVPGYLDGSVFTRVPPPPTTMARHNMDADMLAASGVRRLDNSLSFSASASYVPVTTQPWGYAAPPSTAPETVSGSSCVYTNVPPTGLLVRTLDTAGNVVWCVQPEYTANPPPPPPPPPQPQQQQQQHQNISFNSHSQVSPQGSLSALSPMQKLALPPPPPPPPPFQPSPNGWTLQTPANAEALRVGGASSPAVDADVDADDFEYEPYNSSTLANRRVGSLDRVRCKVHGKERSAQNMVMVRSKTTGEIHWRCKRSSQCKVRLFDSEDTPLSSKDSTLRSAVAEALFSPASDGGIAVPSNASSFFNRVPPPPPQYTLVSPTNASLPLDSTPQSPPYPAEMMAPATHVMTLPPAMVQPPQSLAGPAYFPLFTQDGTQQISLPPPGGLVNVNGVQYRVVHVEAPQAHLHS